MAIHSRLQGLTLDKDEWPRLLPIVIRKYNHDTVSTVHGLTPYEATKDASKVKVWVSIYKKSKDNRMYEKYTLATMFVLCYKRKRSLKHTTLSFQQKCIR